MSNMVAPVVVYPETLSNQALATVKGPPHRAYGSIPKMNDSSQDSTIIIYPSLRVMVGDLRTKMKGKIPTMNVMVKDMSRAVRALSFPFAMETRTERNMNRALTSRAKPTFLLITLIFILLLVLLSQILSNGVQAFAELLVLGSYVRDARIQL